MKYFLLMPALCLICCQSATEHYIVDIELFRAGFLSGDEQHSHTIDTITAVNDSAAFARGLIKYEIAVASHERMIKELGRPTHTEGSSFRVINMRGDKISYNLPRSVREQIKRDAREAVGLK